jgi:hypothetical protein
LVVAGDVESRIKKKVVTADESGKRFKSDKTDRIIRQVAYLMRRNAGIGRDGRWLGVAGR